MMRYGTNTWIAGLCVVAINAAGFTSPATAEYPDKPIQIIVPYSAGGGTDTFARRLKAQLSPKLGQEIVIKNISGAGGTLGMKAAAKAKPDGYTLIFALSSQFAVNVSLFKKIPYDPIKSFQPISLIGSVPYVLVVHPSLGVKSVKGLIDLAKKKPGELSYASAGVGSGAHLTTELLKAKAGIKMLHVPYKGSSKAYPDLLSGRVQVMFATYAPIAGHIKSGKLIPIGVSSAKRAAALPDFPAVGETVDGFGATTWYAFAAPAGIPDSVLRKLNKATIAALKEPVLKAQLDKSAITIIGSSPEELVDYIPKEIEKWRKVIKASGAKVR